MVGIQIAKPLKKRTSPEFYMYFTWYVRRAQTIQIIDWAGVAGGYLTVTCIHQLITCDLLCRRCVLAYTCVKMWRT